MAGIKDIALAANVSLSTVSKAINGKADIGEKTRERILKIAEELDYHPNAFGKSLKNKRSENVGVIICRESRPLSGNPFYSRVLEGIEQELDLNNYNLVLHMLSGEYRGKLPKMLRERKVDGVILVGPMQSHFIKDLESVNLPTMLVDPKVNENHLNQVIIDNEAGAFLAIQHLINNGHTKIGFNSDELDHQSFIQRYSGYAKALKHNSIELNEQYVNATGWELGYERVLAMLELPDPPTAIFSTNDINALLGYKAVKAKGLSIPEDISMVGFDDIEMATMSAPPLTTVRVYKEEMGSIAARYVLDELSENPVSDLTMTVAVKLIERDSVGPVKGA